MGNALSITYQGNLDLSLYAHTLDIPADFKFPPGMKKPLTEYDTALQEYDVALLAAEESRVQLAQAGEKDKAALIASFDAGTADPGTPHAVAAERAGELHRNRTGAAS